MLSKVKSRLLKSKIGYLLIGSIFTILLFSCNTTGPAAATFEVDLTSETSGSITSIVLKAPSDILENNGIFVASTGRLSYTYHLGGNDDHNIEVFLGDKQ